jgi:hypothetical protein
MSLCIVFTKEICVLTFGRRELEVFEKRLKEVDFQLARVQVVDVRCF